MLIVISPSKTYQTEWKGPFKAQRPIFDKAAQELRETLSGWSREDFKIRMKLSDALADQVADLYRDQGREGLPALAYYTGLVYKQLKLASYGEEEWAYAADHLRILSAMYGVLRPRDRVQPYRLDFLTKTPGLSLYKYWAEKMEGCFDGQVIVDLSSNEFGRMLPEDRIQIQFLQKNKKGEWKSQSTRSKMARGRMVDWMIRGKIINPERIQAFDLDGYAFDPGRSTDRVWTFKCKIRE